jgi:hypothetical protein
MEASFFLYKFIAKVLGFELLKTLQHTIRGVSREICNPIKEFFVQGLKP